MGLSRYSRNRMAWRSYNKHRTKRAFEINQELGRIGFLVVPFLLHTNFRGLPGYVEGEHGASGIYLYNQSDETLAVIKRYFPSFDISLAKAAMPVGDFVIESLLMMGSIGTVAQIKTSDCDYWVVIDESKLKPEQIDALKTRLAAIESWAAEKKVEIHFFISDITKTRMNDFGDTDKESAGSSQTHILKEEFYRTAILVAGKDPLWWIFPANLTDEQYNEHLKVLYEEGDPDMSEVVDLGNVGPPSKGELFGALLWQFNKATSSPYKAALKMALLESFISAGPGEKLLCDLLKHAIHHNPDKTDQADPYLLMFDYIRRHYIKAKRRGVVTCLEKCFYLKSLDDPVKDTKNIDTLPYKDRTLRSCLRRWKWDVGTLGDMNNFKSWQYSKVAELGLEIRNFMLDTYKDLTKDLASVNSENRVISDRDLHILGRKLFAIYDKKNPAKIPRMNRVMNEIKNVEAITFSVVIKPGQAPVWAVYNGDIRSQAAKGVGIEQHLLNKARDPISLVMWLVQNQIYGLNTFLYLVPHKQLPVALTDLQGLARNVREFFPGLDIKDLSHDDLLSRARVKRIFVVINYLSPKWKNEIETLHILYSTSWGESFCHVLPAKKGLSKLLDVLGQTSAGFVISKRKIFRTFIPKGSNETKLLKDLKDYLVKKHKFSA